MQFHVLTLFPDMIRRITGESIIGRAQEAGLISVEAHNIRDYSKDKHRRVDDTPYGGGMGMLMAAPPIYDCYSAVKEKLSGTTRVIYLSPQGQVFSQKKAEELKQYDNLILLCGHYEGVDRRVIDEIVEEEISIGDYVLTGGELPACILVDCISRLKEGVLADKKCYEDESISCGMLEYPQYTRPHEFHGKKVPDVLISGNHAEIDKWRKKKSLEITEAKRPDLLKD